MRNPPACEICDASARWWGVVDGYVHYRCPRCRHVFVYPRPDPATLRAHYEGASFYDEAKAEEDRLYREASERAERLVALARRHHLALRLLDVGAATGIFVERALAAGFFAEGLELSERLAAEGRARGLAISVTPVEAFRPSAPFPVVTAWELIEHVSDPCAVLERLAQLVQVGGLLALSTPRSDGVPARLLGTRFPMVCPPEHLSLFSRASLSRLADRVGLRQVAFRSFSNLGRDNLARGFARYVYGRLPLPQRTVDRLAAATARFAAPLPGLLDRTGLGSEMEVVFRRLP